MIIGICGKSGSGKSCICRELERLGAFVIDADVIGKNIMSGEVLEKVEGSFPDCFDDGVLNRQRLGAEVFSNPDKLKILNEITHPAIRKEIQKRIDFAKNEYNYVVVDAAVLIEAEMLDMFDFTVSVISDDRIRIGRITERDDISESLATSRLSAQKPDLFYVDNTDFCIVNNGEVSLENLARQIIERGKNYEAKHS